MEPYVPRVERRSLCCSVNVWIFIRKVRLGIARREESRKCDREDEASDSKFVRRSRYVYLSIGSAEQISDGRVLY